MATLRERNGNYSIRFTRTVNGEKQKTQFSLKTTRKKIAEKQKRRLETEQELGKINVFNDFDFIAWRDGVEKEEPVNKRYLLSQSIDAFINDRTDLAPNSRDNYEQLLKTFNNFIGLTMFTDMVQKKDIQDYCFRGDISIATQNNYLTHLKTFFKWVDVNDHGSNVTKGIRKKMQPENLKDQILSDDELEIVIKKHKDHIAEKMAEGYIKTDSYKQLWFEPMIRFAFKTGLRKSEIIKLKWKHVNIKNNLITVVAGKGGKSRTVVFDKETRKLLFEWKKLVKYGKERYVFESPKSTASKSVLMGFDTPRKNFKTFALEAELSESIHFHSLRHTACTNYLLAGYNLHEVQKLMGHSSISVTERYLHLVPNDLKEKAKKLGLI